METIYIPEVSMKLFLAFNQGDSPQEYKVNLEPCFFSQWRKESKVEKEGFFNDCFFAVIAALRDTSFLSCKKPSGR
jgi:hypothetical protein